MWSIKFILNHVLKWQIILNLDKLNEQFFSFFRTAILTYQNRLLISFGLKTLTNLFCFLGMLIRSCVLSLVLCICDSGAGFLHQLLVWLTALDPLEREHKMTMKYKTTETKFEMNQLSCCRGGSSPKLMGGATCKRRPQKYNGEWNFWKLFKENWCVVGLRGAFLAKREAPSWIFIMKGVVAPLNPPLSGWASFRFGYNVFAVYPLGTFAVIVCICIQDTLWILRNSSLVFPRLLFNATSYCISYLYLTGIGSFGLILLKTRTYTAKHL